MQGTESIVQQLAKVIDYWWAWLVPVTVMYVLRRYIGNLWIRVQMKLSESPYTSPGHVVQFEETGTQWKIFKVTSTCIYLEEADDKVEKKKIIRMPIYKYWNSSVIYRKI